MNEVLAIIQQKIAAAKKILIVSHIRPDGDAVSSTLALGAGLKSKGKYVEMVLADGVPANFLNLPGADNIKVKPKENPDLIIALDCGDMDRIGNALDGHTSVIINIDHHPTNTQFGEINLVDVQSVATSAMLAEHFETLGLTITQSIAEILLNGLLTDSLGFSTINMDAKTLRIAADLVEAGGDLPKLYRKALVERSLESTRYWAKGLEQMKWENGISWVALFQSDREETGYPGPNDANLVNFLLAIRETKIAITFVEQELNVVKVSWRAIDGFNISQIAKQFGGGGHFAAAGATVEGTMEDVQDQVLKATRNLFEQVTV